MMGSQINLAGLHVRQEPVAERRRGARHLGDGPEAVAGVLGERALKEVVDVRGQPRHD